LDGPIDHCYRQSNDLLKSAFSVPKDGYGAITTLILNQSRFFQTAKKYKEKALKYQQVLKCPGFGAFPITTF